MPTDVTPPTIPRLVTSTGFKSLLDPQVMLQTSRGAVLLELNTSAASATVANMLAYAQDGFYNGTIFHRVIAGFMVQGGGFTPGLIQKTPTYDPIPLESNNDLLNLRGTIAMARTIVEDSATAQFFVNLVDNGGLNYVPPQPPGSLGTPGYAVFGSVVTGMSVIDSIAATPTGIVGGFADVPTSDIVIQSVVQTVVGSSISSTGIFSLAGLEPGGRFEYSVDGGQNWLPGSGSSFVVPQGNYAPGAIQVRQFDAAGNQSLGVARFADALDVNAAHTVTANQRPTGSVQISGTATVGQSVSADTTTLVDPDGAGSLATPTYQWLRAGEFIAGANASSYVLGSEDLGASLSVRVTYTDALGRVEHVVATGSNLNGDATGNTLTGHDFADVLSGLEGHDLLIGGYGNDTLLGGPGNDTLTGSAGADSLVGGIGDDTYDVDSLSDVVVEGFNEGIDEVRASLSYPRDPNNPNTAIRLGANIENLTLTGSANIYGIGNSLANHLMGNPGANTLISLEGQDTLNGGPGNDTLDGGSGNDHMIGGSGNDTFYVDTQSDLVFESPNEGIDTVIAAVSFYLYAHVERLTLSTGSGDIFGSGNDRDNTLTGNDGNNLLLGWDGNDTLLGNAGNDNLYGVEGADSLLGGAGIDNLIGGNGNDTLDGGTEPDALYGEDGNDVLFGGTGFFTDILIGGAGDDTLDGSASVASGLTRNQGDYDRMNGGAGNDTYYVDTPSDLTFEALNDGTDTVIADINGAGYYLYANVENLTLIGNTPFGVGNELANTLTGSALANWLLGGAGNDTINGGGGNDVLFGEGGADTFVFRRGTGGDLIGDFTPGTDRIDIAGIGYSSFAQVQARMVQNGGSTAIDLEQGDFVVLVGVAMSSLTTVDFHLG